MEISEKHHLHKKISRILNSINLQVEDDDFDVITFVNAEDGEAYDVWKIVLDSQSYVLKRAKQYEIEVYSAFFKDTISGTPRLFGTCCVDEENYILMEYVNGNDMRKCNRDSLKKTLDALIELQQQYWEDKTRASVGYSYEKSLEQRINRGKYLNDANLENAYGIFLSEYQALPRTLCHDDLLPFNVLTNENSAVIIDWEYAGILPYPVSIARLIAHGEEDDSAFFYMKKEDRQFAIDYYYENLIKHKDITYTDYRRSLDLFLFYEYCEWIMLGVKYADADMKRYEHYLKKAKRHLKMIKNVL